MRSMTGYGRGENTTNNRKFTVEIKSVNHRYNDITIKLPRSINYIEDTIKKKAIEQISRGKTDIYIGFETTSKDDIKISLNTNLADSYIEQLNNMKNRYSLKDDISISLLSEIPDILTVEKEDINEDIIIEALMPALEAALHEFIKFRKKEGQALKDDITLKLETIKNLLEAIKLRSPKIVAEYKNKLQARLNDLLGGNLELDESRLITEITIFADRCSIDEEITRLFSHINQAKSILDNEEIAGRKLDFLIQEMNREANTICSKSNDIEITQLTLELKSEIEKMREQVQNIE